MASEVIVVDTSVWVAAFFNRRPREILNRWRRGAAMLGCSPLVLGEYERILMKIPPIRNQARAFLDKLRGGSHVVWVESPPAIHADIEDPSDLMFLQCAVGAGARVVISLDRHLLQAQCPPGVMTMRPHEYLQVVGDAESIAGTWRSQSVEPNEQSLFKRNGWARLLRVWRLWMILLWPGRTS